MTTKRRNRFQELCFWLAGAGVESARKIPDFEQTKLASYGMCVLIPFFFSILSASYLVYTINDALPKWIIAILALIWGMAILFIDRSLLVSYRPNMGKLKKLFQVMLRFMVAILVGLCVSHPLTLLIFKDTVDQEVKKRHSRYVVAEQEKYYQQIADIDERILSQETKLSGLQSQLQNSISSLSLSKLPGRADSQENVSDKEKSISLEIAKLTSERETVLEQISALEEKLRLEIEGKGEFSKVAGYGSRSKQIEDSLTFKRGYEQQISESIGALTKQKTLLITASNASDPETKALLAAQMRVQSENLKQMVNSRATLNSSIEARITATNERLTEYKRQIETLNVERQKIATSEPANDLIAKTLAFHETFHQKGGGLSLGVYILFSLLFVLIDTIPIVNKFFSGRKGAYDHLIEQVERSWAVDADSSQAKQAIDFSGNPLEVANQIAILRQDYPNNIALAEALEIKPQQLSKYQKLTKLSPEVQELLLQCENVSLENGYQIACIESADHQLKILEVCENKNLSQAQLRGIIAKLEATLV